MRGLPARRIASCALCAALLVAVAGPTAAAAERDSAADRVEAAAHAPVPVPDADVLRPQVEALAGLGGVLTPVTDLLNTVLKADDGQLSAEQAAKLGDAVKSAFAKITGEVASAAAVTPPDTGMSTTPSTAAPSTAAPGTAAPSTAPSTSTPSTSTGGTTTPSSSLQLTLIQNRDDAEARSGKASADLLDDVIDALGKAVDALLAAVTSGEATQVESTLPAVISALVDTVAATMVGTELPAPDLAGLSLLPSSSPPAGSLAPAFS
ncbi:hypothetical protein [Streptomyces sp. NPDC005303]|uniref:hypothetical protein n=1 Tax=Streptomyces sp. NPDC005303 TaxID=3155713 RepID=UPI0033A8DD40